VPWLVALSVFVLNLPFGVWRARTRKFSVAWFVSIHAPIPVVVAMRYTLDLGLEWTVPGFFLGQFVGSRFGKWRLAQAQAAPEPDSEAVPAAVTPKGKP